MPRRNRPERRDRGDHRPRPDADPESDGGPDGVSGSWFGLEARETDRDGEWIVRPVTGAAAGKVYRCPGCDHEIAVGTPHIVAWRADGLTSVEDRRHWHRTCWANRSHRHRGRRR